MQQELNKWVAQWIGYGDDFAGDQSASPMLAADFYIDKSKYTQITAYISGLGLFEISINGKRISDTYFDPGESNYAKRVYYVAYDIMRYMNDGLNTIGIVLGNGQYTNFNENPVMEKSGILIEPHRYQKNDGKVFETGICGSKKVIAEIHGVTDNGDNEIILTSGEDWYITDSPIVFQNWYGGEDYDARKEIDGWDCPNADRTGWQKVKVMSPPGGVLTLRAFTPIKIIERFNAVKITKIGDRRYIVDFGKNGAGFSEIRLENMTERERGIKIKLLPCEEINEDGSANQESCTQSWSRTKRCEISDSYIVKGGGAETWHPRFVYHGFRYMEVTGFPYEPSLDSFTYCRLRTANSKNGVFETDNELIRKINEITERSIESNMFGAFTDCPQIEKLGWLETSHLMLNSMAYGWDIRNWIPKIVQDICDSQVLDNAIDDNESYGYVPAIAPEYQRIIGLHKDPNWGGACILTSWNYYVFYNDKSILEKAYFTMKNYLCHLAQYEENGLLTHYAQMGDWGEINEHTPVILVENCAYYQLLSTVAKTAGVLGNLIDKQLYEYKAKCVKEAFHRNRECYNSDIGEYGSGSQSSYGCALYSGIVPEKNINTALEGLIHAAEKCGYHISSGEVGLKQVFSVLNKYGRDDIVYKMVINNTPPSYKHFIDCGLTTLPEYWNYEELWYGMVRSRNHAMMGHVKEWLVHAILGVRTTGEGFGNIRIQPFIPPDTTRAKGRFVCGFGEVSVEWQLTGEKEIMIRVEIPDGIHAEIIAPDEYVLKDCVSD